MKITLVALVIAALATVAGPADASSGSTDPGVPTPAKQGTLIYQDGTVVTWVVRLVSINGQHVDATSPLAPATGVSPNYCWYGEFAEGNDSGFGATYYEHWNPTWCGNGSTLTSVNLSNHYQTTTGAWSATGETGIAHKTGCSNGCTNDLSWILASFHYSLGGFEQSATVPMCLNVTGSGNASSWRGSTAGGC